MNTANDIPPSSRILSHKNIQGYLVTTILILIPIILYHLLQTMPLLPPNHGGPPNPESPPPKMPPMGTLWPIWGMILLPNMAGIVLAGFIFIGGAIGIVYLNRTKWGKRTLIAALGVGVSLMVLTNLIHGWAMGIESPIGGQTEIYSDVANIVDAISFLANYNQIQPTLSTHALTQPPGAVLTIYALNLLFGSPALIAIGLAVIAATGSVVFLYGILKKHFSEEITGSMSLLFLMLPAVQVYYLANIYAIVATLAIGAVYFYFHGNAYLRAVGTLTCLFLGTFISFLFVFVIMFIFLFEILHTQRNGLNFREKTVRTMESLKRPLTLTIGMAMIYGALYLMLGFNYIDAFLYASAMENPNGFMLFASPLEYLVTRIEDVLDILVFLGPVLVFFAYSGLVSLKNNSNQNKEAGELYHIVLAALIALILLFLTGAPKKGETARICMFVLPFVMITIAWHMQQEKYSQREILKLILLVLAQAVIMQTIGVYVW
ncbi:MAG: hypothetical protein ACTSYL_10370 [Candidatus Thorarchaeota archaeon]